jgi:hypothetical protein
MSKHNDTKQNSNPENGRSRSLTEQDKILVRTLQDKANEILSLQEGYSNKEGYLTRHAALNVADKLLGAAADITKQRLRHPQGLTPVISCPEQISIFEQWLAVKQELLQIAESGGNGNLSDDCKISLDGYLSLRYDLTLAREWQNNLEHTMFAEAQCRLAWASVDRYYYKNNRLRKNRRQLFFESAHDQNPADDTSRNQAAEDERRRACGLFTRVLEFIIGKFGRPPHKELMVWEKKGRFNRVAIVRTLLELSQQDTDRAYILDLCRQVLILEITGQSNATSMEEEYAYLYAISLTSLQLRYELAEVLWEQKEYIEALKHAREINAMLGRYHNQPGYCLGEYKGLPKGAFPLKVHALLLECRLRQETNDLESARQYLTETASFLEGFKSVYPHDPALRSLVSMYEATVAALDPKKPDEGEQTPAQNIDHP